MTVTRVLLQGTPVKLRNGQWGVKVLGPARKGDQVMVKAKNGKEWETTVTRVWWTGDDKFSNAGTVSICSDVIDVAAMRERTAKGQAWTPERIIGAKCEQCGKRKSVLTLIRKSNEQPMRHCEKCANDNVKLGIVHPRNYKPMSVKELNAWYQEALKFYGESESGSKEERSLKMVVDDLARKLENARKREEAAKTPEQKAAEEVARLEAKANKVIGLLHQAHGKPSTMRARGEQLGKILSKLDEAQQAAGVSDSERAATWEHKLEWAYS